MICNELTIQIYMYLIEVMSLLTPNNFKFLVLYNKEFVNSLDVSIWMGPVF